MNTFLSINYTVLTLRVSLELCNQEFTENQ